MRHITDVVMRQSFYTPSHLANCLSRWPDWGSPRPQIPLSKWFGPYYSSSLSLRPCRPGHSAGAILILHPQMHPPDSPPSSPVPRLSPPSGISSQNYRQESAPWQQFTPFSPRDAKGSYTGAQGTVLVLKAQTHSHLWSHSSGHLLLVSTPSPPNKRLLDRVDRAEFGPGQAASLTLICPAIK